MGVSDRAVNASLFEFQMLHKAKRIVPRCGGAEVAPCSTFEASQEIELQVIRVFDFCSGQWSYLVFIHGRHKIRRDEDEQFLFGTLMRGVTEQRTDVRQITQQRNPFRVRVQRDLHQAGQCERLALL